jgi:hypothetical protein
MLTTHEVQTLTNLCPMLRALSAPLQTLLQQGVQAVTVPAGTTLFELDYPCTLFLLIVGAPFGSSRRHSPGERSCSTG